MLIGHLIYYLNDMLQVDQGLVLTHLRIVLMLQYNFICINQSGVVKFRSNDLNHDRRNLLFLLTTDD